MKSIGTGRAGWHQATPNITKYSLKSAFHFTALAARMKVLIITLALWGWLPICLVVWININGVQRDD